MHRRRRRNPRGYLPTPYAMPGTEIRYERRQYRALYCLRPPDAVPGTEMLDGDVLPTPAIHDVRY
eukprot:3852105-Rhodomonas_salina.1